MSKQIKDSPSSANSMSNATGTSLPIVANDSGQPVEDATAEAIEETVEQFVTGRGKEAAYASYIGDHLGAYVGYATNPINRQHVASGGIVTTLLATALQAGLVDGVAVAKADFSEGDIGYRLDILTDPDQVQNYGTSAYFNIPIEKHWRQLDEFDGRLALCALPCHTSILRNRKTTNRGLSNLNVFISLFCGHNNEPELLRFVFEKRGIKVSDVTDMRVDRSYLGGCIRIGLRDGSKTEILFRHFNVYRSLWFFSKQMCRYCDDHLGAKSDLSIGDVFTPEYRGQHIKRSAVIVRSEPGQQLLDLAVENETVTIEPVDPSVVFRAQKRIIVPSGDLHSRYLACKLAGFHAKRPTEGRFRARSFLTYWLLMLNDRISQSRLGQRLLKTVPRPLLYAYVAAIKLINNSLRASK